jgi:asparagine synthase (glutamine-hydrolysing)
MCGIAAIFGYGANASPVDRDELIAIRDSMINRGPDGEGLWVSEDRRIGLAHRRLTIVDLTDAGLQPMWSNDRNLCVTFNGEIYNYPALRSSLEARGCQFASHCDTEVLLHLYAEKGAEMVHDLRGMYAFAIWDVRERTLFLARDPFGIKPLYYADDGRTIRVASQVKALLAGKHVDTAPEAAGHVGFFLWGSVPDPFTLYRGICALPAGHILTIREGGKLETRCFCFVPDILREAEVAAREAPDQSAGQHEVLHAALRDSAEHHLMADVPVGVFLSAGLDSSTITALVSESHQDVRTVTLGFHEYRGSEQDETGLAEVVARAYRTNHQTIWITRRDFEGEAARLFEAMDRPSIDGVNTYFVSLATKRAGLKVALSGLGGDELFGGYPSFHDVPRIANTLRFFRGFEKLGRGLRVVSQEMIKHFTSPKYAGILEYGSSYPGAYLLRRSLFMPWELPELLDPDLVREGWRRLNTFHELGALCDSLESERLKIAALELCCYMRQQLLRDSDWAGMAHSLEIRVPLVDVKLLRAIAPLLASRHPPGKRDMALSPRVPLPEAVLSRPKTGFSVPVRDWLLQSFDPQSARERGLRGWAREVYSRFIEPTTMHGLSMRSRCSRRPTAALIKGRKLRAVVLVTDAFGGLGGIAKFNRDFLTALSEHERIQEVIVLPRLMPRNPEPTPAKVRTISAALGGKFRYLAAIWDLAFTLRRLDDAELMIFCGHINLLPAAAFAKLICHGTLHLTIYGIDSWKPLRNVAIRASLRFIDGFISISRVTKRRFEHWTHFRCDQGLILPCSVDMGLFTPGPPSRDLIERYGLEGRKVLMTFGRLESKERYKGFDEVLEILVRLQQKTGDFAYIICGDGPDRGRLINKARRLGFDVVEPGSSASRDGNNRGTPRVVFTGGIPEREKADHYRLANVYVMPSSGEGFGIVFLEALACGVPVIGSKADGSREALREGKLGLLVDPRAPDEICDAIIRVLTGSLGGAPKIKLEDLEYFSEECFTLRLHEIIDAIAPAPANDQGVACRQIESAHLS